MPNRLAGESSPYLLQHKDNPVDWYPWSDEALERAKRQSKPIFLSIGYSACHWCHVMEHESFEDEEIARELNAHFVCIKVDREERPDLDQIYMLAVQLLTGHGGWPMSVFLTPTLVPFYGGTYWPPRAQRGMAGFEEVIAAVHDAWENRRELALEGSAQLAEQLKKISHVPRFEGGISSNLLENAEAALAGSFDPEFGGFGRAPKFPHPMDIRFLFRLYRRKANPALLNMACLTLDQMAAGGIYDHLGGGFARYSVDERWLVPHFEKMLYDNALLVGAYLDGFLATGNERYARVVRETLEYTLRDMTDPMGGFYSSEDADSEGEEGRFYVWTKKELVAVLGDESAETFGYVYDVSDAGNFEGKNILNRPKSIAQCATIMDRDPQALVDQLAKDRQKLLAARALRTRPGRDDKILVSWNGLMIDALARAAGPLREPRYLEAATKAAQFLLTNLQLEDGRLLHTWRNGVAKLDAYLDDYACLINSLVSVYEAGFDERFVDEAIRLADATLDRFGDHAGGGLYYSADAHETPITRAKDMADSSIPSGNSMAATAFLRLGRLCGGERFLSAANEILQDGVNTIQRSPTAAGQLLLAADFYLGPSCEIVLIADPRQRDTVDVLSALRTKFIPNCVVALQDHSRPSTESSTALRSLFEGKSVTEPGPTLYLCQNHACQAPQSGKDEILAVWDQLVEA